MLLDILLISCQVISTHQTSLIRRLGMVHTGKSIHDNLRFISCIFLRMSTTDRAARVILPQLNKTEIEVTNCEFPLLSSPRAFLNMHVCVHYVLFPPLSDSKSFPFRTNIIFSRRTFLFSLFLTFFFFVFFLN